MTLKYVKTFRLYVTGLSLRAKFTDTSSMVKPMERRKDDIFVTHDSGFTLCTYLRTEPIISFERMRWLVLCQPNGNKRDMDSSGSLGDVATLMIMWGISQSIPPVLQGESDLDGNLRMPAGLLMSSINAQARSDTLA
jgi:hypothetical protein